MSSSGTVTFRTNRNEILKGALRLCTAYDQENTSGPTTNQISFAAEALNLMVKAWEAKGLQLWERKWGIVFPNSNQGTFILGSPGPAGDHACISTPLMSGFIKTALASAASSGATTITVAAVTASLDTVGSVGTTITTAYYIGVELDTGAMFWTTVNGAPSGTTVTLTAALTGAAASGNRVFCYQTKMIRPLRILDAFVRSIDGGNDIPCRVISREEYNRFGIKTSAGTPIQLYYDPQVNSGHLYVYPTFQNCDQLLVIEFTRPIDDFSQSTDDVDMPQEWGEALKFNLALRLAPEYEVPTEKYKQLKDLAIFTFDAINGYDQESPAGFLIQPATWNYPQ